MSTSAGTLDSSIMFFPFGATRTGSVNTTKEFTGQRLDATGLYYYNARYYDPQIGRFISADTASPDLMNPQTFNKYSYCFNNPLNRNDPTGNWPNWANISKDIKSGVQATVNVIKANPIGVVSAVAAIALLAIVAAPVVIMAAGLISTAVAAGGIGGLATLGAATLGIGVVGATAAVENGPTIETNVANTVNVVENLFEGDAYVNIAGCGLPDISNNYNCLPDTLYHYTSVGPDIIMNQGLNAESGITFATDEAGLSPSEAQTGLNLDSNRPLPTNVYSIDTSAVLNSGLNIYGPFTITGRDGLPTGVSQYIVDRACFTMYVRLLR